MSENAVVRRRRGRPPKSDAPETFRNLVDRELLRKHRVCRNGKFVRLTLIGIICDHLVHQIILGNKKAKGIVKRLEANLKNDPEMARMMVYMHYGFLKVG